MTVQQKQAQQKKQQIVSSPSDYARYCCIAVFALWHTHTDTKCIQWCGDSDFMTGCCGSPVAEVGVRCLAEFVQDVHKAHLPQLVLTLLRTWQQSKRGIFIHALIHSCLQPRLHIFQSRVVLPDISFGNDTMICHFKKRVDCFHLVQVFACILFIVNTN